MGTLRLMHININGLKAKLTELTNYVSEHKPHIICINESKLNKHLAPNIPDYKVVARRDRAIDLVGGGGVVVYTSPELSCIDVSPDLDDMAVIELRVTDKVYCIASIYAPSGIMANPSTNKNIINQVNYLVNKYSNLIILGDLNCKHTNFGSHTTDRGGEILDDLINTNNLFCCNNPDEHTHLPYNSTNTSIIDYALISNSLVNSLHDCYTGEDLSSDHLPIHLNIAAAVDPNNAVALNIRSYKKCNWDGYTREVAAKINELEQNLNKVSNTVDIDNIISQLEIIIKNAFENNCPITTMKHSGINLSKPTLALIKSKRKCVGWHKRTTSSKTSTTNSKD